MSLNFNRIDVIMLSYTKDNELYSMTNKALDSLISSEPSIRFNIYLIETNPNFETEFSNGYPNAHVIIPNVPFNYNKYLNIGLKKCQSDFIIISNNDVVFNSNWLTTIIEAMNLHNAHSASPYPCNPNRVFRNFHSHIAENPVIEEGYKVCKHIWGYCIVFKKEILEKVVFDEQFKFWHQDSDYAMQLQKYNFKHILVKNSRVEHLYSKSHRLIYNQNYQNFTTGMEELFKKKWNIQKS